jgi:hypothetical protein
MVQASPARNALEDQIAAVKTLTGHSEALAKALDAVEAAQTALNASYGGSRSKVDAAAMELEAARATAEKAKKTPGSGLANTEEQKAAIASSIDHDSTKGTVR